MVDVPFASDFCRIRCRRMRWVLQWLPWRRSKSLDSRPLRSEIIELRVAGSLVSPQPFRTGRSLSNGANQPPAGKTEPKGGCKAAKSVAHASAEIDR